MATKKQPKSEPKKRTSPLAQMKEQFKDKEALVDRLLSVVDAGDAPKEGMKSKLLAASNKKLLRLFQVGSEIKEQYGSSQKLAEALAKAVGKAKDQAYVSKIAKLAQRSPSRVLDMMKSAAARAKSASA